MAAQQNAARQHAAAQQQQGRVQHQADLGRIIRSLNASNARTHELTALREATRIPKYNRAKETFVMFAERFRNSMQLLGEEIDVATCKRMLVSLLERPEKLLHDTLPPEIRDGDDWTAFLQALFEIYHPPAARRIARDQLFAIRQISGETVDEFRAKVEDAALLAYPYGEAEHERQSASRDAFVRGLRQKLRDRVQDRDPETLTQAYHHAVRYELNGQVKDQEEEHESSTVSELVNALSHVTASHPREQRSRDYSSDDNQSQSRSQYYY